MATTDMNIYILTNPGDLNRRLDRIERLLVQIGRAVITEGENIMSELDDQLTTLETDLQALSDDEARELADLQALENQGQTLTPAQEQRLAALDAKIKADTAAIDTADPAPVVPEPAPAPAEVPAEPAPATDGTAEVPPAE